MSTTKLDARQSVIRSALPMVGTSANAGVDTVLSAIDPELSKLFEDRNALLTDGGTISFTGTDVQFTEALNLILNSRVSGSSPLVISLGSTTRTLTNGQTWYAVIDRSAGTATSTIATSLPAVTSSNQEVFLIAKRVDAGDSTQRVYFRNGSTLNAGQSARLGGSGTGTVTSVAAAGPTGIATWSSAITASGTLTQTLSTQSAGTFLAGPTSGSAATPTFRSLQTPTVTKITATGAGTFNTPAGALYIRVKMVGAGGGGSASGTALGGTAATSGGTTFFRVGASPDLLVANGGSGTSNQIGGSGGTASLGTGPIGTALTGGSGGGGGFAGTAGSVQFAGGNGASTPFGGGGGGGAGAGSTGTAGVAAAANTGSGGGGAGAGSSASTIVGGGGGAGGYVDAIIVPPSTQAYSYSVGAKGTGAAQGTNGTAGGNGADGYIEITVYYQ